MKRVITDGELNINSVKWIFADDTDARVKNAALRIFDNDDNGVNISISHENAESEGYVIDVKDNKISIVGEGAAGAFYGLMTIKKLINDGNGSVKCCHIEDSPDMQYRGFYQDITRGRIATVDTLKKLVDTMAENKMNSLQLYVEHTYEFKEYEFCRDELGYISKAEIMELDKYCKDRFIDLVPSLACFGHLYHLLQYDKYKHLCELKDYEPTQHHFAERMRHHTINPLLDESFELIASLIDQHMEAFTSNYFNICCDETFDLCADVNSDKDKGDLYIGFVKKLIEHIKSKGKTVMMWGDIILKYPERVRELPDDMVFLNWNYAKNPNEDNIKAFENEKQIVCPGTSTWYGFTERTDIETDNILTLARYGYKYGARGILNTNWGDLGNVASIDMAMYGLVLGAEIGWNKDFDVTDEWKRSTSVRLYGNAEALSVIESLSKILPETHWLAMLRYPLQNQKNNNITADSLKNAMTVCDTAISKINEMEFKNDCWKNAFMIAAQAYALTCKWYGHILGYDIDCNVDYAAWRSDYKKAWLADSKESELKAVLDMFDMLEKGELKAEG